MTGVLPATLWPRLRERIADATGLHFPPERQPELQRALLAAAPELGFADVATCADALLSSQLSEPQLRALAVHLTVGETYFFRDPGMFRTLATRVLPELIERRRAGDRRLRLWSAACSTGEEPYSLAILLQQVLPDWREWNITLLATDINERSIDKAMAGRYSDWSFRTPDAAALKSRYFTRTQDGRYEIAPDVRGQVTFAQLNLATDPYPSLTTGTNAMDLIVCRNVLMYFSSAHTTKVVSKLHEALLDEGWLIVAPSECSQTLFAQFAAARLPEGTFYRKSGTVAVQATSHDVAPQPTRSEDRRPRLDRPQPASPRRVPPRSSEAVSAQSLSDEARELANRGRLAESLAVIERWLAADKLDASAHYLSAMIHQELGHAAQARIALQRALFLQPEFALAHFALGNLSRSLCQHAEARRHLDNALHLVRRLPPDAEVPGSEGLSAGRLTEIISALVTRESSHVGH
jgi:chemotaxis protein methyltransferase CheR